MYKQINKAIRKLKVNVNSLRYDEWRYLNGDKSKTPFDKQRTRRARRRIDKIVIKEDYNGLEL